MTESLPQGEDIIWHIENVVKIWWYFELEVKFSGFKNTVWHWNKMMLTYTISYSFWGHHLILILRSPSHTHLEVTISYSFWGISCVFRWRSHSDCHNSSLTLDYWLNFRFMWISMYILIHVISWINKDCKVISCKVV